MKKLIKSYVHQPRENPQKAVFLPKRINDIKTSCEKEFCQKLRKEYNYFNDIKLPKCFPSLGFYVNEYGCNVLVQK